MPCAFSSFVACYLPRPSFSNPVWHWQSGIPMWYGHYHCANWMCKGSRKWVDVYGIQLCQWKNMSNPDRNFLLQGISKFTTTIDDDSDHSKAPVGERTPHSWHGIQIVRISTIRGCLPLTWQSNIWHVHPVIVYLSDQKLRIRIVFPS